jgi:hypothetical protein
MVSVIALAPCKRIYSGGVPGKSQFLPSVHAGYRRKKKHRDRSQVLDFQLPNSLVGRE